MRGGLNVHLELITVKTGGIHLWITCAGVLSDRWMHTEVTETREKQDD